MENYGIHIDFAWRTFRWDSEASIKAHVHCVIVGFSSGRTYAKTIYEVGRAPIAAKNNNFPWPAPSKEQKARIEKTAQGILDARAKYPDCSLADLYDEVTMPSELRKAHQENDKAVMEAYGFNWRTMTESDSVAELFELYRKLTETAK